jgi:carbon-monoxide dehydrogenase iron sulfur subunit
MTGRIEAYAEQCTGCRLCELACSMQKIREFNPKLARIRVHHEEGGLCTPVVCTQCEEEWCVQACPTEAIARDSKRQIVVINLEDCTGCSDCVEACPIGAVGWHTQDGTPFKCDECGGQPVCVPICPAEALAYELQVRNS